MHHDAAAAWDADLARLIHPAPLVQSWAWGEAQRQAGVTVKRLRFTDGMTTVMVRGRPPLAWAEVDAGPVPSEVRLVDHLRRWSRRRGLVRLRINSEAPPAFGEILRSRGFQARPELGTARTLLVPLGADDVMLARFREKTRYNVRVALRQGVEVREGAEPGVMAALASATAQRRGIFQPDEAFFRALLERLAWCRTFVARFEGEPLAAAVVAYHDGRAYYLFGGSSGQRREVKPAYAVQWAAMRSAARAGCVDYDMWGIPSEPDPTDPKFGLWQFKHGFGGRDQAMASTWDLILAPARDRLARILVGQARRLRSWRRATYQLPDAPIEIPEPVGLAKSQHRELEQPHRAPRHHRDVQARLEINAPASLRLVDSRGKVDER